MNDSDILGYSLIVFGLGVLTGLLIAPRRGEESREIFKEHVEDYCGRALDFIGEKVRETKKHAEEYEKKVKEDVEGSI
jgi:gas vesicle protein